MRRASILSTLVLLCSVGLFGADKLPGDIQLLKGYHAREEPGVDASILDIKKVGGPSIHFEMGVSEGSWADPQDQDKYAWYREQTINGHRVRVALIRPGLKTVFEPEDSRGMKPGSILLVTFLLGSGEDTFYTADFSAKVANDEEMADVLLIALTFNPDKLYPNKSGAAPRGR